MTTLLQTIAGLVALWITLWAGRHALFFKREPRSAQAWLLFILLLPPLGGIAYYFLGVNRVETRARELKGAHPVHGATRRPEAERARYGQLERLGQGVSSAPLVSGNRVTALHNGEAAYPAMLAAIDAAEQRVWLASYIFDPDAVGMRFVDALTRARERGVEVRVLVDGVGELYSWPRRITRTLAGEGVSVARYLPPRLFPPASWLNLRNHRKVLVVDEHTAFTGGMNIGQRHCHDADHPQRTGDIHFRVAGPVVTQFAEAFADDWTFTTGESLALPPPGPASGEADCRVIVDGPNEDLDRLKLLLVGAVGVARRRIAIMTPYFLPPRELIAALQAAALRGVQVDLILPGKNNLAYVHWATRHMLWEILQWGCRVYYQPPPFAHTKLFLMDGRYALVGSANLDPRSLRLNFELGMESYDRPLVEELLEYFDTVLERSREVTLAEVDSRPWYQRVRDGSAWVFAPYL